MKRLFAYILTLLAILINVTSFAHHKKAAAKKGGHSLIWQISGNGLQKPSYLFGTIHVICKDDYIWTQAMNKSLEKSEKVCFEMDTDDPSVMMAVAAGMIDKSGKKLADYFTPEQYKLVKQYIKDSVGMDISMLEQMKPIFLQTLLDVKISVGCSDPVYYEDSIGKTATKENKEILGLETAEEQLAVLQTLPVDTVIKEILEVIEGKSADTKNEYDQLIAAYRQQDLPRLYELIKKSEDAGNDMAPLLDDRNKKWIARMSNKMKISSVFFAVGAGHLYGENGVINLLKKDGYTVEIVK